MLACKSCQAYRVAHNLCSYWDNINPGLERSNFSVVMLWYFSNNCKGGIIVENHVLKTNFKDKYLD